MTEVLTSEQLIYELNNLKCLINDFDYSELNNVTFLNLESLYTYIAEFDGNPFQRQYEALQAALDVVQPFIPFATGDKAKEFLLQVSKAESDDEIQWLKQEYTDRMRLDFVNAIRLTSSDDEWDGLIQICESIRQSREDNFSYNN
ncbi:MAG: hypothetical protein GX308_03340 [Epulopiscium sp.]|nr:hypothetical protein [Candidatus Epulonipiscium sp.]